MAELDRTGGRNGTDVPWRDPGATGEHDPAPKPLEWPKSAMFTVGTAAVGASVGYLAASLVGAEVLGRETGYWHGVMALAMVGAGIGWLVGALVGTIVTGAAGSGSRAGSVVYVVAAALVLLAGLTRWWVTDDITPPFSHRLRFQALQDAVRWNSLLACVTFLVLATRRRRRLVVALGGVLGIAIVVVSTVQFATGPCPVSPCPGPR